MSDIKYVNRADFWTAIFVGGAIGGYALETIIGNKEKNPVIMIPWSIAIAFVVRLKMSMKGLDNIKAAFISTIIMAILECLFGKFFEKITKQRANWKYEGCTICDDYVSLPTSLLFFVLILLSYNSLDKYFATHKIK